MARNLAVSLVIVIALVSLLCLSSAGRAVQELSQTTPIVQAHTGSTPPPNNGGPIGGFPPGGDPAAQTVINVARLGVLAILVMSLLFLARIAIRDRLKMHKPGRMMKALSRDSLKFTTHGTKAPKFVRRQR